MKRETIHDDGYCETLQKLRQAIQNKRYGLSSNRIMFLHDEANHMKHMLNQLVNFLEKFGWEISYHPPYSHDLIPSDYHLLLHLKKWLGTQKFENDKLEDGS